MTLTAVRRSFGFAVAAVALAALTSAAGAQSGDIGNRKDMPRFKTHGEPPVAPEERGIQSPNARMMALVNPANGGTLIRKKNVESVQRVAKGVYCIRPTASANINVAKSIPLLTVEYYFSNINEGLVQFAHQGSPCGTDRFAVYTLGDENLNAVYSFSNNVAFIIYVP